VIKVILKTVLGFLVSILGFSFVFFYLLKIEESYSFLFLLPAAFFIILGGYLLIKAGKSEATIIKKPDVLLASKDNLDAGLEEVFKKNKMLSSQWAKTVEKRDKLKLLEISTAEDE
jgi:hypothetical protein